MAPMWNVIGSLDDFEFFYIFFNDFVVDVEEK